MGGTALEAEGACGNGVVFKCVADDGLEKLEGRDVCGNVITAVHCLLVMLGG